MKKFFFGLSLRRKILYSYILFVGISCILFCVYSVQSLKNEMEKSGNYIQNFNRQVSLNLDATISNMDRIRFLHLIDGNVLPMLLQPTSQKDAAKALSDSTYLKNAMNHMTNMNRYVLRATIVTEHGDIYSNVITNQDEYIAKIESVKGTISWEDKKKIYYTGVYDSSINQLTYPVVTSISNMYRIGSAEPVASIFIDLNFKALKNSFDHILKKDNSQSSMLLLDSSNQITYLSPDLTSDFFKRIEEKEWEQLKHILNRVSETQEPLVTQLNMNGTSYLISVLRNQDTNWRIMNFMPIDVIYANGLQGLQGFFIMMGLVMVMILILCLVLPKEISKPISVLADYMSAVDQGYVQLIDEQDYHFHGEMGELIHRYNQMGERINDSIEKIYVQQLNQKQTELKMLQFQINPHFLYNTLNTISSIASLEDMDEIVVIANGLSSMFQYNIKGSDIVLLLEEISQVKNYLGIQSIRFLNQYEFQFDIDEKAQQSKMLKFLIQPIVENSLMHAFTKAKDKNILKLSVKLQGDTDIMISICDNGVGIEESVIKALNKELSQTDNRTLVHDVDRGIGLRNVNARIKNYYGSEYGIWLESTPMESTVVYMLIKKLD